MTGMPKRPRLSTEARKDICDSVRPLAGASYCIRMRLPCRGDEILLPSAVCPCTIDESFEGSSEALLLLRCSGIQITVIAGT